MITRIKAWWIRRKLDRARAENAGMRMALAVVRRLRVVRTSRRARRAKDLRYRSTRPAPEANGFRVPMRERIKAAGLWLVTCDVRHYQRAMANLQ